MSKALPLISEAMQRFPDNYGQQVAFVAGVIGKLVEHQLGKYREFDDGPHAMLIDLLDSLQLPRGPLVIPGEEMPLFETTNELGGYIESRIPLWQEDLKGAR